MDQAFDEDVGQLDEQTETGDRGDYARKVSPTRSRMYSHFSQLVTSRVASSARRSVIEHCSPNWSKRNSSYG